MVFPALRLSLMKPTRMRRHKIASRRGHEQVFSSSAWVLPTANSKTSAEANQTVSHARWATRFILAWDD